MYQDGLPAALWSALPSAQRAGARPNGNLKIHFFGTLIKPGDQAAPGEETALQRLVGRHWHNNQMLGCSCSACLVQPTVVLKASLPDGMRHVCIWPPPL